MKKKHIAFWISTALFCLVFAVGGTANLVRWDFQVESMQNLGYPLYLMTILGTAKLLGVVAVLLPGLPRLKEWAYAGFAFDMLGAAASHAFVSDPVGETVLPLIILAIGAVSYLTRPDSRRVVAMTAQRDIRKAAQTGTSDPAFSGNPKLGVSRA